MKLKERDCVSGVKYFIFVYCETVPMLYIEYQPSTALLPYIETYWIAQGHSAKTKSEKILPDGCVDIIFSFGDSSDNDKLVPFLPNIIGTMTVYSEIYYYESVSMLGIRFKPAGITAFTRVPISEFTDQQIDMTIIDSLFDKDFYSQLPELELIPDKIKHIDSYLLQKLDNIFELDQQMIYAVDLIRKTNGMLPLNEVAYKCCLSLRHFERKFKTTTGVTPKTFSKIIRFKHTLSYLRKNKDASLFSVAVDCGYYDHSHLTKEFKILSGNSPSHFSE